jgi:RHS repeat-associated protein
MPTSPNTLPCQYRYDPLDRLIGQTRSGTPVHQRFYCKSRLATEIQGATGRSIVQAGDQLLAQQQRQGDALDTTLLATDMQRSVLQTIKPNPPRQPIAYSPYGHHPAESGLTSLLGFNGERWDPVTGCYLLGNGYRAFNPVLMRFNSPDSFSPFGKGGLNTYAYCKGDPLNHSDPNGHFPLPAILKYTTKIPRAKLGPVSGSGVIKLSETVYESGATYYRRTREFSGNYLDEYVNGELTSKNTVTIWDRNRSVENIDIATGKTRYSSGINNATLRELSYSKTSGSDLKTLHDQYTLPVTDWRVDEINLAKTTYNRVMKNRYRDKRAFYEQDKHILQIKNRVIREASKGNIRGVHPLNASLKTI